MELSLKGKNVLITGAGAGIGLACAEAFVTAGANVAICDVEQERLNDALGTLTKLGGTNAIVDVTLAVLLSFTTPPILSTQNQNFDGIGRLLISPLISLSVVPKCAFAVAGNFLMGFSVTNVNSRGKDWKPRLYRFYLWLAAALWLVQLTTTVITVASLVVIPASFSISRALVGHSTLMQFTLLFGLLCVGAPTLCKTARRTCAEICAMKHASEVDKSS